jgi:hypothetical protein
MAQPKELVLSFDKSGMSIVLVLYGRVRGRGDKRGARACLGLQGRSVGVCRRGVVLCWRRGEWAAARFCNILSCACVCVLPLPISLLPSTSNKRGGVVLQ